MNQLSLNTGDITRFDSILIYYQILCRNGMKYMLLIIIHIAGHTNYQ